MVKITSIKHDKTRGEFNFYLDQLTRYSNRDFEISKDQHNGLTFYETKVSLPDGYLLLTVIDRKDNTQPSLLGTWYGETGGIADTVDGKLSQDTFDRIIRDAMALCHHLVTKKKENDNG